jgi:hypothetical protein
VNDTIVMKTNKIKRIAAGTGTTAVAGTGPTAVAGTGPTVVAGDERRSLCLVS